MKRGPVLHIAEIPYETGELRYRYARYLASDGQEWIRHGLFQSYYPTGQLASEGYYENGKESGVWKDFHDNGRLAAQGEYRDGVECGTWRYWDADGNPE